MNYQENVLLIREEYVTAFDTLKHWNLEGRIGDGGVVVALVRVSLSWGKFSHDNAKTI